MRFTGENVLNAPVEQVWDALLDPAVLVRTIPGCSRLETTGEHSYDMTVTAGVAAIRGTYAGTCRLSDLRERQSLRMDLQGAGAPGTIGAEVTVSFDGAGDGTTRVTYEADAVVGGMVGGVGQRMLTSVSRRMAGEFFANVDAVLSGVAPEGAPVTVPPGGAPTAAAGALPGQVFTAPAPPVSRGDDFLRGIAVGAGLVLAGVLAGAVAARRR
jgi:uncharacterized protein